MNKFLFYFTLLSIYSITSFSQDKTNVKFGKIHLRILLLILPLLIAGVTDITNNNGLRVSSQLYLRKATEFLLNKHKLHKSVGLL